MVRPSVRLAAAAWVATGLLLSVGALPAAATPGNGNGHGGGNSANDHSNGGSSNKSDDKPSSSAAGNNSNSSSHSDNHGGPKASKTMSGGQAPANKPDKVDKVDKPDKVEKPETTDKGNSSGGNGTGNGNVNGNVNVNANDQQETPSSQTPSAPAASDDLEAAISDVAAAASEIADSAASVFGTSTAAAVTTKNDTVRGPVPAPPRPSSVVQSGRSPEASSAAVDASTRGDVAALSTRSVSGPVQTERGDGARPTSATGRIQQVAGQFIHSVAVALKQVSLKDVALAALPGIAGLLFVFATGIGLGHRQARFGFVMQSTGALRFAAGGPIGVVRTGGFIEVAGRKVKAPAKAVTKATDRPTLKLVEPAA